MILLKMNSDIKFIINFLYDCCKDKYFIFDNFCFRNIRLKDIPDELFDHLINLDNYSQKIVYDTIENINYCYNDNDDTCGIINDLINHLL